uniref:Uncharacterized protein n=1 Tax=Strongyloides venezuelensis TaxID=75913 RepID=A0A0K0G1A7_STRVS
MISIKLGINCGKSKTEPTKESTIDCKKVNKSKTIEKIKISTKSYKVKSILNNTKEYEIQKGNKTLSNNDCVFDPPTQKICTKTTKNLLSDENTMRVVPSIKVNTNKQGT